MIVVNEPRHGHILARAMGSVFTPQSEVVIARVEFGRKNGRLEEVVYGGALYEKFTGTSVMMHVCGLRPNWINRPLLWVCFDYPFNRLKVIKVVGATPSTNAKALALAKHLGFTLEAKIENGVPGGDTLISSMERKDCRWLDLKLHTQPAIGGVSGQAKCA